MTSVLLEMSKSTETISLIISERFNRRGSETVIVKLCASLLAEIVAAIL